VVFIDLEKMYDKISREVLMEDLTIENSSGCLRSSNQIDVQVGHDQCESIR